MVGDCPMDFVLNTLCSKAVFKVVVDCFGMPGLTV